MRTISTIIATIVLTFAASAQRSPIVMFYNVESLYDTIPALFYNDGDYTPDGALHWNTTRYQNKLQALASVVDSVAAEVVALAEVENEGVVRDLVMTLGTDYNYIHRTSNDARGMDLALLYKGDKFFPSQVRMVESGYRREFLYVPGKLCGERVDLVVCHLPSQIGRKENRLRAQRRLAAFVDSLHRADTAARIIIAGDFNDTPSQISKRKTMPAWSKPMLLDAERRGEGTIVYDGRWLMYDNFWVDSQAFSRARAQVYIRRDLISTNGGARPIRTFTSRAYTAGASDHLPIILHLHK